ncbi:Asp-tRNA(Asn)/Glu-tRNA(Gln) amidotransferase subunit GatC [bacterium]|jgi:aspartyl/glutamyl-tRNA(Asn/Gln) amidotransferase C subunit|nr:Asp-tRNA(Asn)/Glu-tRNA(Gln) amidotransferase subunit GatC [bacterium]MBT3795542.1 Asp-tRNA(Asn)/Glu-tRNA(Gln) amidotransferase subunit GatC [bacterium]MBT4634717.1 Asp-tRNA(Asn)/Glu-tRNA(Gln) amidotransferase subunit GatC [bacterium]
MVEKKEVLKISKLSRLLIEENKIDSFLKNFSEIIEYINLLDQADTTEIGKDEEIVEYSFRDDSEIEKLEVEDVVKNSAKVENNFFAVTKVIDEE